MSVSQIVEAFQTACIWEAVARKVGNVHRGADFAGTGLTDFLLSAAAAARAFDAAGVNPVGLTIELAARATRDAVGQNTNLGIVLLLAPLAAVPRGTPLSAGVRDVLASLTVDDAVRAYHAIRLANPGGLGDAAEQDVRQRPTVTLLEAMKLAADRDLIARQYANGFADIFESGVPAFLTALAKFGSVEAAVIDCQLRLLAAFADSLIVRKCGLAVAEDVRRRAAAVLALGGLDTPEGRRAGVELDGSLRSDGNRLNPGTTADLVTACLFVALREDKVKPSAQFRWPAPDWL
jgi:triphosphoribosyl-dephospho-CoA synthase